MDYTKAANENYHFGVDAEEAEKEFDIWASFFSDEVKNILEEYFLSIHEEGSTEYDKGYLKRSGSQWDFRDYHGNEIFRTFIDDYGTLTINLPNERIQYNFIEKRLNILTQKTKIINIFGGDRLKIEIMTATIPGTGVTVQVKTNYKSKKPLFIVGEKPIYSSIGTGTMYFDANGKNFKSLNYSNLKHTFIQKSDSQIETQKKRDKAHIFIYFRTNKNQLVLTIRGEEFNINLESHTQKKLEDYMSYLKSCIEAK